MSYRHDRADIAGNIVDAIYGGEDFETQGLKIKQPKVYDFHDNFPAFIEIEVEGQKFSIQIHEML
jgi:hypothetical protein